MPRQSVLDRNELFIAAAVVTCHGMNITKGFRQVEVRWYLEQFVSWIELIETRASLDVQNTQVARYVASLIDEGFVRVLQHGKHPLYRLTRPGLFAIVSRLVTKPYYERREYFFFVYFFIRAYRRRLVEFVQIEGKGFSHAMQMELNTLLDADVLLEDQIAYVRREMQKFDKRLTEQKETFELAQELFKSGKRYEDVLKEIDKRYPFSLDPQRRYTELYKKATEKQSAWELTVGTAGRLGFLWLPARRMLQHYLSELELLKKEGEAGVNALATALGFPALSKIPGAF
jgi:hypothetical protein